MYQQQQQQQQQQYETPDDSNYTLKDWQDVRRQLSLAVLLTQDAICAEKEKRRFLLEEIAHNVLPDGTLAKDSNWRRRRRLLPDTCVEANKEQSDRISRSNHFFSTSSNKVNKEHCIKLDHESSSGDASSVSRETSIARNRAILSEDSDKGIVSDHRIQNDEAGKHECTTDTATTTSNKEKNIYFTGASEELFRSLLQEQGSGMKVGIANNANGNDDDDDDDDNIDGF